MQADCLDNMIMDVIVEGLGDNKVRVKFLAISGGCGPELIMDMSLAKSLEKHLRLATLTTGDNL